MSTGTLPADTSTSVSPICHKCGARMRVSSGSGWRWLPWPKGGEE